MLSDSRIMDTYSSYFGALTTLRWSPDSRFILTGGQDDLISIFSVSEQRLLARCQGHASYVGNIKFEDFAPTGASTSDLRRAVAPRFASVGDDGRLVLVRSLSSSYCLVWLNIELNSGIYRAQHSIDQNKHPTLNGGSA